MSFLKRVGGLILKGLAIAKGLLPYVEEAVVTAAPQTIGIFEIINSSIQDAEVIGQALGKPGPEKFQIALPLVGADLLKYTKDLGHKVKDESLFNKAVQEFTQASVDLQNSLE